MLASVGRAYKVRVGFLVLCLPFIFFLLFGFMCITHLWGNKASLVVVVKLVVVIVVVVAAVVVTVVVVTVATGVVADAVFL